MGNSGKQMVRDHKYSYSPMKNIKNETEQYFCLLSYNKHFIQLTRNVDFVHGAQKDNNKIHTTEWKQLEH